jgi:protein angel
MNSDNVGLILLLEGKGGVKERICVATTHILYNPNRGDIKLAQVQLLLANIDRLAFKKMIQTQTGQLKSLYHPIVLTGDFNCVQKSKMYDFLKGGILENYRLLKASSISGQFEKKNENLIQNTLLPKILDITDESQFKNDIEQRYINFKEENNLKIVSGLENALNYSFGGDDLKHPFSFETVYDGSDEVTSCVDGRKCKVDFIFYHKGNHDEIIDDSSDEPLSKRFKHSNNDVGIVILNESNKSDNECSSGCLKLVSKLELFNKDQLASVHLPDKKYSSDHFMLASKFQIC